MRPITFSVLCMNASVSRAEPVSPYPPRGSHTGDVVTRQLTMEISQFLSPGSPVHLSPIMGWPVSTETDNRLLPVSGPGSLYHQCIKLNHCCIDFTLICIQIVHNKHCTSGPTSHLSCCLSLNWTRRKISRGKQKLDQIGHEFHIFPSFLK